MTKEGREFAWLFLRLAVGAMMFGLHGWARLGKLYAYFILGQPWSFVSLVQRIGFPMPAVFAVASALVESFGALLLLAGIQTRWVALLMAVNMAVATAFEIGKGPSGGPELAAMYLIPLLALALGGAGRFSLDARRGGSR